MTRLQPPTIRQFWPVLLAGILGCGSDLVLPAAPGSGLPVTISKVGGDAQTGTVGEQLPSALKVQVLAAGEQPAAGLQVIFEPADPAAGTVSPNTATTNSVGEAVTQWKLGTTPGPQILVARLVGADSLSEEFHAEAKPAPPDTLSPTIPVLQPGQRDRDVETPPQVRVVDHYGNPIPGVPVAWQVTAGEGQVASPITNTDGDGKATVEWRLGDRRGYHKLTAAIGDVTGSPVTFTAYVIF